MRHLLAILLLFVANSALADEHWTEDVVVADGFTIKVKRSVESAWRPGGPLALPTRHLDLYYLNFDHPRLPETIRWRGTRDINPISLQVIDDVPYLAVYAVSASARIYSTPELYGCPEVPFAFLKFDLKSKTWQPIKPSEAPEPLLKTNMTSHYSEKNVSYFGRGRHLDTDTVNLLMGGHEGGYFQRTIPRNAGEWNYRLKDLELTTREKNDCRPPLEKIVDAVFPFMDDNKHLDLERIRPKSLDFEIVEDKVFDPPLMVPDTERNNYFWFDKETVDRCRSYFVDSGQNDSRLKDRYKGFAADSTGKKFTTAFHDHLWCGDDFTWAIRGNTTWGYFVIAKYTKAGDVLQYIKLNHPKPFTWIVKRMTRYEDGYLYLTFYQDTWKEGFRGVIFTRWQTVRVKVD